MSDIILDAQRKRIANLAKPANQRDAAVYELLLEHITNHKNPHNVSLESIGAFKQGNDWFGINSFGNTYAGGVQPYEGGFIQLLGHPDQNSTEYNIIRSTNSLKNASHKLKIMGYNYAIEELNIQANDTVLSGNIEIIGDLTFNGGQLPAAIDPAAASGGITYFNGTELTTHSGLTYNGTNLSLGTQATATTHAVRADRSLTINGTTNQVNVSGGTQNLIANRTWTISLPQNIHAGATPTFAGLTINGNVEVTGSITADVLSVQTLQYAQTVEVDDNLLIINNNESGQGVSAGIAGIEVERGTETNYQFVFAESPKSFRIGEVGDLQAVATREDSPTSNGFAIWNNTEYRFDTVTRTITAGSGLSGGGTLNTGNITLSHADTSSQASVDNNNGTVIQDITLDTYGHITALGSVNLDTRYYTETELDAGQLDNRYYTETEADSRFVNVTGDTMTGDLIISKNGGGTRLILGNETANYADSSELQFLEDVDYIFGELNGYGFRFRHDGNANVFHLETGNSTTIRTVFQVARDTGNLVLGYQATTTSHAVRADRTITINGTTNQVNVSTTSQNLTADRTWTLSLPQDIHTDSSPAFAGLTIGSTSKDSDTIVRALSGDSYVAGFEAYGSSQGTGYFYVGQAANYGGGFRYDGDGTPDVVGASDTITFYRRSNNVEYAVFYYLHGSSDVNFQGSISVLENISTTGYVSTSSLRPTNIVTGYVPYFNGTQLDDSPIYTNGTNVSIGSTNSTYKLDVNGTSIFRDDVQIPDNTNLTIGDSSAFQMYHNTNTYMYNQSGNFYFDSTGALFFRTTAVADIYFRTNNTESMFINGSNQKVGIGTTSPLYKLDVYTSSGIGTARIASYSDDAFLYIDSNLDGLGGEESGIFLRDGTTFKWELYKNSGNGLSFYDYTRAGLVFRVNPNGNMFLMENGGNVLIGTTTDSGYKLDVNAGAENVGIRTFSSDRYNNIYIADSGGTIALGVDNGALTFGSPSVRFMTLNTTGNVLINTTTDSGYKLDVNGTTRFQNHVRVEDAYALHSATYSVSDPYNGYYITQDGSTFGKITANELHVKSFIADIEMALVGGQVISKSVAKLASDCVVTTTGTLVVEEIQGFTGQVFANGDYIRLRVSEVGGSAGSNSLSVTEAWGTVVYVSRNDTAKTQTYTFTKLSGTSATYKKGSLAIDYGVSGNGILERVAIGEIGAKPYDRIATWTTAPYTDLKTINQIGDLSGVPTSAFGSLPTGTFGTYTNQGFFEGDVFVDGTLTASNIFYAGRVNKNLLKDSEFGSGNVTGYWSFDAKTSGTRVYYTNDYFLGSGCVKLTNSTTDSIAFWQPFTVIKDKIYTLSVYAKNIDCPTTPYFSFPTGNFTVISDSGFSEISSSEWKRFTYTVKSNITGTGNLYIRTASSIVQGSFLLDGFQLEEGSYATSYQPTDGTLVSGYGAEKISNGTFNDTSIWIYSGDSVWSISGGTANCVSSGNGFIQQAIGVTLNKTFLVTFTVSNYVSGQVRPNIGGYGGEGASFVSANGTYSQIITATHLSSNTYFYMYGNLFQGSIDNISVKEVLPIEKRVWMSNAGIGGTIQNPVVQVYDYGMKIQNANHTASLENSSIMIGNITGTANSAIKISNDFTSNGTGLTSGLFGYTSAGAESFALRLNGTASIAGWDFTNVQLSKNNVVLNSTGYISLGSGASGTSATGIYFNQDGTFNLAVSASEYIRKTSTKLEIKSSDFDLSTSTLHISDTTLSAESGKIKISGGNTNIFVGSGIALVGTTTGSIKVGTTVLIDGASTGKIALGTSASAITIAGTEVGSIIDGAGNFKTYGDANNYIRRNGTTLEVKSTSFNLITSGNIGLGATSYSAGNGVWISSTASNRFRVGNVGASRMQWTDTNLEFYNSSNQKVVSLGASNTIASWNILTSHIYSNKTYLSSTNQFWTTQTSTTLLDEPAQEINQSWTRVGLYSVATIPGTATSGYRMQTNSVTQLSTVTSNSIATGASTGTPKVLEVIISYYAEWAYDCKVEILNASNNVVIKTANFIKETTGISELSVTIDTELTNIKIKISAGYNVQTANDNDIYISNATVKRWNDFVELSDKGFHAFRSPGQQIKFGTDAIIIKGGDVEFDTMTVKGNLQVYGTTYQAANDLLGTTSDNFMIDTDATAGIQKLLFKSTTNYLQFNATKFEISHDLYRGSNVFLHKGNFRGKSEQIDITVDGTNSIILAETPISIEYLHLYKNGQALRRTIDYTLSTKTITLTTNRDTFNIEDDVYIEYYY